MCYVLYTGTHNSAITLANGYGNEDYVYTKILQLLDKSWFVRTNNQYFSLTDQLNMGLRFLELDTHYFLDELHIAHCGGLHEPDIDDFIQTVNDIIHDFGLNVSVDWDTETVGCDPSLSSIPAGKQRSFESAVQEVASWLFLPENKDEFLLIFFDDQMDLLEWGKVPELLAIITKYFGKSIYTPPNYFQNGGKWPNTIDEMVKSGYRVLFMSGSDYGYAMNDTVFAKYGKELCNWDEPSLHDFTSYFPQCQVDVRGTTKHTYDGQILRPNSARLVYGPINGGGLDKLILNETTLPAITACNVNIPCPDLYTPSLAEAQIWSWAPQEPRGDTACVIQNKDGRWQTTDCSVEFYAACRSSDGTTWKLSQQKVPSQGAAAACKSVGGVLEGPVSGHDNAELSVTAKGFGGVWIKVDA